MKKLFVIGSIMLLVFMIPLSIYFTNVPTAQANQEKIIYNLPYPGLLPDHPLYIFKAMRDNIIEKLTRDNIKKAEYCLLISDKRAAMAIQLAKAGKGKLAVETFLKGEKHFFKIPVALKIAKKQGTSPTSEFVTHLKVSNAKHRELLESILKELPQGNTATIMQVLSVNNEIKKQLDTL